MIRAPVSQCLDGAGGLIAAAGYKAAAVHNEKVWNIVRTVVFVNDGAFGIIPHTAGSHEMTGAGGIFDRQCPFPDGTCSIQQVERPVPEEAHSFEIIRMAFVCDAQCG